MHACALNGLARSDPGGVATRSCAAGVATDADDDCAVGDAKRREAPWHLLHLQPAERFRCAAEQRPRRPTIPACRSTISLKVGSCAGTGSHSSRLPRCRNAATDPLEHALCLASAATSLHVRMPPLSSFTKGLLQLRVGAASCYPQHTVWVSSATGTASESRQVDRALAV